MRSDEVYAIDFYCDQVLSGQVPVDRLVETANVLAFHHTQPYWSVHVVIIPKKHIPSLAGTSPDDVGILQEMLLVASRLCREINDTHDGCRMCTNNGSYQTTKHLHFYIHAGQRLRSEDGATLGNA